MFYTKSNKHNNPSNERFTFGKTAALLLLMLLMPATMLAQYTRKGFHEMGITLNTKVYTINAINTGSDRRGSIYANGTTLARNTSPLPGNPAYQFVFVTANDNDTSTVYLYNLQQKKFAKFSSNNRNRNSITLVTGTNNPDPVYVYPTDNTEFKVALAFSPNCSFSTTTNGNGNGVFNISGGTLQTLTYAKLDNGNRWNITEAPSPDFTAAQLAEARSILNNWLKEEFHYKGASKRPLQSNGMQSASVVDYYYYVDSKRQQYGLASDQNMHAIDLQLPFMRYLLRNANNEVVNNPNSTADATQNSQSNGNNYEPKGYIRWYNYHNDRVAPHHRLIKWQASANNNARGSSYSNNTNILKDLIDMHGDSLGYVSYHPSTSQNSNAATVGVAYVIPSEADDENWQGDTIACDVSFYTDYNVDRDSNGDGIYDGATQQLDNFRHEPTLSMRYIYHILPAKRIANDLRNALINSPREATSTLGDKGLLTFGMRDPVQSTINLRTDLQDIKFYYFYPLTNPDQHHVYHETGDSYGIDENDIPKTGDPVEAASLEYRVYTADRKYWRVFKSGTERMFAISLNGTNALNSTSGWKKLDGTDAGTVPVIRSGNSCYLVGLVVGSDGKSKCPFFNTRLDITSTYPMSDDQITSGHHTARTTADLVSHFGSPVAEFSFDNEDASQNFGEPSSTTIQNISNSSTDVNKVPTSFDVRQYSYLYTDLAKFRENLGYNMYYGSTYSILHGDYELFKYRYFYDRTHTTDPSRYGYFLYTDASDESRILGYQDFTGNLCAGSQLIISAWVANTAGAQYDAQPELRFVLYGVNKDSEGHVTSSKQLASLCSGDFANNIQDYNNHKTNTWYQVFGVVTLPTTSGVDNYTDYRIAIDNYCTSTNGADYAIDDINVYQSNSKLTVVQEPAMCSDEDADHVSIKIKGNYSVLRDLATNGKLYYRFVRQNGSVVTGKDFYGKGHNDFGEATVPASYDANATLANGTKQFEINSATGVQELVLVRDSFGLQADTTYYISMTADTTGTWGEPSIICSIYSDYFHLVRQNIYIDGTQSSSATMTVSCDDNNPTKISSISVAITAPDKANGGETTINTVHFDWFRGTREQYNHARNASGKTLDEAIKNYRAVYPTGAFQGSNSAATASDGTKYTDEDKALILKYISTDSLNMSYSTDLNGLPVLAGTNTYLAIPAQDTITVNGVFYELCPSPMPITVRGSRNGPGLTLGIPGIVYPSSEPYRSLRIGLPQIKKMLASNGSVAIPISGRLWKGVADNSENLRFVNELDGSHPTYLYISDTNDPTINLNHTAENKLAEVTSATLANTATTVNICKIDTSKIHEGYWYQVELRFMRTDVPTADQGITNCASETYITLKIVPEYLTWNPTVDNGLNSNWNNDGNWRRSTALELNDPSYEDYRTATYPFQLYNASGAKVGGTRMNTRVDRTLTGDQPASYVPMYFSKVIIATQTTSPYPMLGYIRRQSGTNLILSMSNEKSSNPTTNIQYDMEAAPRGTDSTNYVCRVFDGNLCEQVYFKTTAQLRMQQYLNYKKAYVELALPVNEWGTFTTPMKMTLAGDMYVPKENALQTTPLFHKITIKDTDCVDENGIPSANGTYGMFGKAGATIYSRLKMPTYQKLWGTNANEYTDSLRAYSSYDSPYQLLIYPSAENGDNVDLQDQETYNSYRNSWSHSFNATGAMIEDNDTTANRLEGRYGAGMGVAGKIGDDYATDSKWMDNHRSQVVNGKVYALMRLPKDDDTFSYRYYGDGTEIDGDGTARDLKCYRVNNYRLGIDYDPTENSLATHVVDWTGQEVQPVDYTNPDNPKTNLKYVLIGNPYTSSITAKAFVEANDTILQKVKRPVSEDSTDSVEVNRIWILQDNVIYEVDPTNINNTIAPGQAFFVKLKMPERYDIVFTARMQTDPTIHISAARALSLEDAAAKAYRITDERDIIDVIDNGAITRGFRCWSPEPGYIGIDAGTYNGKWNAQVYTIDGRLVTRVASQGPADEQVYTGRGLYIVRISKTEGMSETFKVAVR